MIETDDIIDMSSFKIAKDIVKNTKENYVKIKYQL